jgi:cytoskeleton protein RodZ
MMDQEMGGRALIGTTLRDAREAQKLSVVEVALRLRLSEKQINALESDDFNIFGSAIFVRGFIKSYARLLKIDPQPLLDAHFGMYPQEKSHSISYNKDDVEKSVGVNFSKFTALVLGVLLLLALLVWVSNKVWTYQSNNNASDHLSLTERVEQNLIPDPLPQAILPVIENQLSNNPELTATEILLPKFKETNDPSSNSDIKILGTQPKKLSQAIDSIKSETAKSEPAKSLAIASDLVRVKLFLTGSSWIAVQDKNGKTVFSKLTKAGTEEYVDGMPPLKFHRGNASATQLVFNGESIDLGPSTYNNIARITVGEH